MRVLHSIAHSCRHSGTDALSATHNLQGQRWLPYERGAHISPKDLVQS
ncbi:hypothetical protein [Porphyromonas sp. COT-290 OH3588]|nr:hypothetical protein [Porphyromonas sp. COT-290 OH3588]